MAALLIGQPDNRTAARRSGGHSRTPAQTFAAATAAGRDGDADLVFVTSTGQAMSQRNVSARGVGKAATRTGLGKVSPLDLRRSFCSLAGRRGIDPIIAANITGHSLATWQSAYAKDFGKQHRDEARATLLAAGFGSVR